MPINAPNNRDGNLELPVYTYLPFTPTRGQGSWLYDAAGTRYLDVYGGHAVALTGHCHPHVVEAITKQARELLFYSNAVHSPLRDAAGQLLLSHAQPGSRVFHCCSGSEANDNALKIARKLTGRRKIVSFENGFHGRTLAALSATGIPKYRETAGPVLVPHHTYVPFGDLDALQRAVNGTAASANARASIPKDAARADMTRPTDIDAHADDAGPAAAIICEPIQSVAGLFMAEPAFYRRMAEIAQAAGALLIFDELQTGLGRCGRFFFADLVGVKPDMITLAKGLASGIPCGAVIVSPDLASKFHSNDLGSTFGGGQIPMAAMKATLEVIESEKLVENAATLGPIIMNALKSLPRVRAVRGQGLLLGIDLDHPAKDFQSAMLKKQVVVGTSSAPTVVRLMPPLTITREEVDHFLSVAASVLQ